MVWQSFEWEPHSVGQNYSDVPINHSWWWALNTSTHSVVPLHIKVMGHLYGALFPVYIALWSHNAAFTTYVGSGCHWNGLYSWWGDPFLFAAMLVNVMRMNVEEPIIYLFIYLSKRISFLCLWCNYPSYKGDVKENQDPTNRDTTYLSLKPCLQTVITPPWGIFMPGNCTGVDNNIMAWEPLDIYILNHLSVYLFPHKVETACPMLSLRVA